MFPRRNRSLGRSAALNRQKPGRNELSDLQFKTRPTVCVLRTVLKDEGSRWIIMNALVPDKHMTEKIALINNVCVA